MKRSANNVTYLLRVMVGFYLLYIDYSLLKNWQQLDNKILFVIFIALFGIIGLLLIVFSLLRLIRERNEEQKNTYQEIDQDQETDQDQEIDQDQDDTKE